MTVLTLLAGGRPRAPPPVRLLRLEQAPVPGAVLKRGAPVPDAPTEAAALGLDGDPGSFFGKALNQAGARLDLSRTGFSRPGSMGERHDGCPDPPLRRLLERATHPATRRLNRPIGAEVHGPSRGRR